MDPNFPFWQFPLPWGVDDGGFPQYQPQPSQLMHPAPYMIPIQLDWLHYPFGPDFATHQPPPPQPSGSSPGRANVVVPPHPGALQEARGRALSQGPRDPAFFQNVFDRLGCRDGGVVSIDRNGHARVRLFLAVQPLRRISFYVSHFTMLRNSDNWRDICDRSLFTAIFWGYHFEAFYAMKYVLTIMHAHPQMDIDIPDKLDPVTLVYVYYYATGLGGTRALEPWDSKWEDHLTGPDARSIKDIGHLSWLLFYSKVRKNAQFFDAVCRYILFECTIDDGGNFLDTSGQSLETIPSDSDGWVDELLETLKTYRLNILELVLGKVSRLSQQLECLRNSTCQADIMTSEPEDRKQCEAFTYGLIATGLTDAQLWPIPRAVDLRSSINTVVKGLRKGLRDPSGGWLPLDHQGCRPFITLHQKIYEVVQNAEIPEMDME